MIKTMICNQVARSNDLRWDVFRDLRNVCANFEKDGMGIVLGEDGQYPFVHAMPVRTIIEGKRDVLPVRDLIAGPTRQRVINAFELVTSRRQGEARWRQSASCPSQQRCAKSRKRRQRN